MQPVFWQSPVTLSATFAISKSQALSIPRVSSLTSTLL